MKIQNLRFFAAVMQCGGVTQASQQLHVSQPAVSTGLKLLEQELGEPLFERLGGRRRLVPTAKAAEFHEHALGILKQCDTAIAAFRAKQRHVPHVRIGVLRTISSDAVASVVAKLSATNECTWTLREGDDNAITRWLRQGRIDVAWTTVGTKRPNTQVIWHEPFVCLAGREHPLARRRSKANLKDLDGEVFVLRGSCELRAGKLQSAGVKMRTATRVERDDLALRLVAQGVGIAIAPRSLATPEVVVITVSDLDLSRAIGLRWRTGLNESALKGIRTAVMTTARAAAESHQTGN